MKHDISFHRPLIVHTLILAVVFTVVGGVASLTVQQMLRRGANQPQRANLAAAN